MFKQFQKPVEEAVANDTIKETINYRPLSKAKFGLNIAVLGQDMLGKSLLSYMFGYFNSKYISKLDPEEFPNTIELLKGGYMPEVERIVVLDLDNSFEKNSSRGTFYDLTHPLREITYIDTIYIPKRQSKAKEGTVVNVRSEELFKAKRKVEDAIDVAMEDYGEGTLFIIDSMSSYYECLNDMFSIVYEAAFGKSAYSKVDQQNQYQIRNAWWAETMKKKRNFPGWQIDTIKVIEKPDHWKKKGQSDFNFKWAEGSGNNQFNLDQIYWIKRDSDGLAYFDIVNARYKSLIEAENMGIYYPLKKRTAPFVFIEQMAPYLISGQVNDEELW